MITEIFTALQSSKANVFTISNLRWSTPSQCLQSLNSVIYDYIDKSINLSINLFSNTRYMYKL